MNENDIVKAIEKVIDDLRKEYTEYHGQYKLLTHFGNLNFEMGKYFALTELLKAYMPDSGNPFDCTLVRIYEENKPLIEVVTEYCDKQYGKLKEA